MRNAILGSVLLAMSIAYTGCSNGSEGGGSGGTDGPQTAFSFDEESAEQAASATAAAVDLSTKFGGVMSNLLSALASGLTASPVGVGPKAQIPIPPICAQGEATLNWEGSGVSQQPPFLTEGDVVTLTLADCAGSPVSTGAANGTIILTILSASGGLPYIGGIIRATAELDLSIAPDITISGSFEVNANLPNLALANLFFGARSADDRITLTRGFFRTEIACFDIYQRVGLAGPGIEFFRPLGVMSLDGQIFTLNNYESDPPNISFEFAGFDATPVRGSLKLTSGDHSARADEGDPDSLPACASFSGLPPDNGSSVEATFTGGGCVTLGGTDTEGESFSLVRIWDDLLDVGRPGEDPGEQCEGGGGGTGGSAGPTPAEPPPVTCAEDERWVAYADAYVRGGVENADTPFGNSSNLLIKGDPGLNFARKTYLVFDLSSAPEGFTTATLVLTLDRHVDRQPADLSGIIDNDDWDPADPVEGAIIWNEAPRNDLSSGIAFLGQGNDPTAGVRVLVPGYTFDRADLPADPDPDGTQYAFDVTDFMLWAVGRNESFSASSPGGDNDKFVTLLLALSAEGSADGSSLDSKDVPDEEMCNRPFLHFE